MNHLLLSGELDFAFVDSFSMDKGVSTEPVYDEVLELCASKKLGYPSKPTTDAELYQKLVYVDYQEEQSVLSLWMKHHTQSKLTDLDVRLYVMDAQAISKMILSGAGAGVLPGHLVEKLIKSGEELQVLKGSGKPLHNTISLAFLEEKTLTPSAKATFDFLKSSIHSNSNRAN
jgi:DNA-binding transcriptional LysR family regulator